MYTTFEVGNCKNRALRLLSLANLSVSHKSFNPCVFRTKTLCGRLVTKMVVRGGWSIKERCLCVRSGCGVHITGSIDYVM